MTVRTPLLAAALFAVSVTFAPSAYADTGVCELIDPFTGIWQQLDSYGRPTAQVVITGCDRSESSSTPSFVMETWGGVSNSGSLYLANLDIPNHDYGLVVDVIHPYFAFSKILYLMEHVRAENDRFCYAQSRTGSKQAKADIVWARTDEGRCFTKATKRLDQSMLYASPQEQAAAAAKAAQERREQCSKDCASTQSECKREWGSHPMCDSNFYACGQRCAAAP